VSAAHPLHLIEAAYRLDVAQSDWLLEIARTSVRVFGAPSGSLAMLYDTTRGDWIDIQDMQVHELPPAFVNGLFNHPEMHRDTVLKMVRVFNSVVFGSYNALARHFAPVLKIAMDQFSVEDVVMLNAIDPTGRGCMVTMPDLRDRKRSPGEVRTYRRLAAHIAAAGRLRRKITALAAEGSPADQAEAVLTPAGRMEHASGPARTRAARERLRDALLRIDSARSRRLTEEKSVAIWQALVAGRWSVVEHFERDGKRYYLAHKNDPELAADRRLSPRECQVLGYAGLGHSDKLIAYALGLSRSTVGTLLTRARRKLGAAKTLVDSPLPRDQRVTFSLPSPPPVIPAKKSLPLSSTTMKAGKSTTSIFQTASMPSSGYSSTSTFLMQSLARRAAGPPIEPR